MKYLTLQFHKKYLHSVDQVHIFNRIEMILCEIKIPFFGDQLISGCHTPSVGLIITLLLNLPYCIVRHHFYSTHRVLYMTLSSFTQVGTLKYFREKFNPHNVSRNIVLNSCDSCADYFCQRYILLVWKMLKVNQLKMHSLLTGHINPPKFNLYYNNK